MNTRILIRIGVAFLLGILGAVAIAATALALAPQQGRVEATSTATCTYNGSPIPCRAAGGTWSSILDCYATGTVAAPTSSTELAIVNAHNSGPAYPTQEGHWVQCVAGMLGTRFPVTVPVFIPTMSHESTQETL